MSRVTVTMCDCCRKEITNKLEEPCSFMTVIVDKRALHFCHLCGIPIVQAINEVIKEKHTEV